jgi:hypothetical protein
MHKKASTLKSNQMKTLYSFIIPRSAIYAEERSTRSRYGCEIRDQAMKTRDIEI